MCSGDHRHIITFQSKLLCVKLQQEFKDAFDDTTATKQEEVKDQQTISYDDVRDTGLSHSESLQEVKTPLNEGMEKSVIHVHFKVLCIQ